MNGNWPLEITFENLDQMPPGLYLDIRDKASYLAGHHPRFMHAPLDQIGLWSKQLDRSRPIYLVCDHGDRAKAVALKLREREFYSLGQSKVPKFSISTDVVDFFYVNFFKIFRCICCMPL